MLKTFKSQLYAITLSFSAVSIFLLLFVSYYHQKKEGVMETNFQLKELQKQIIKDDYHLNSFLLYEALDTNFYIAEKSHYIKLHELNQEETVYIVSDLIKQKISVDVLDSISIYLDSINFNLNQLVNLQLKRGFQDYGIEGSMRDDIHWIENHNSIDPVKMLMLRRHEKDYIIRHQDKYVNEHQALINDILSEIKDKNSETYKHISHYAQTFIILTQYDAKIGRMNKTGMVPTLNREFNQIEKILNRTIEQNNLQMRHSLKYFHYLYWGFVILFFTISITVSIYISRRASSQLNQLARAINRFVRSGFKQFKELPYKENNSEIHILTRNFNILQKEILDYIHSFEKKVEEQTFKLRIQNKEIEDKNAEILAQQDKTQEHLQLIYHQNKQLQSQNLRLTDSIYYAERIQQTLLPPQQLLKTIFPQSFIYFVPKDIVSGDFYWIKQNTEKNTVCLAVADCTGHGVPGSMLSMLGISFLNEIQQQQIKHTPASVLNHLRDKFVEVTGNANAKKSLNDGMDIGLAEIDYHRHKLKFAGANRDVYVLRESEIIVIKGDNMPIGRYIKTDKFSVQEFDLQPGDCIYLFTDGYNDQFGGKKNEKFKRRNFKKLLLAIQDLEFEEQMDVIQKMHNHWRGQNTQVDDILIIGFQFNPENPFKTNQISSLDSLEISN